MGSTQTFTANQRIEALRAAAEWCREGAPHSARNTLFDAAGRPCALGKVLLGLNPDPRAWTLAALVPFPPLMDLYNVCDVILGLGDEHPAGEDERTVQADKLLRHAAINFDADAPLAAAACLEAAADLLCRLEADSYSVEELEYLHELESIPLPA